VGSAGVSRRHDSTGMVSADARDLPGRGLCKLPFAAAIATP